MAQLNCPEGKVELPIDIWYCKIIDKLCPIQAWIDTEHWEVFDEKCIAQEPRKSGVKRAITTEQYRGFHHILGQYLCPLCRPSRTGSHNRRYHYPWQLFLLRDYVPVADDDLNLELVRNGLSTAPLYSAICRTCLNEVLAKLAFPSLEEQERSRSGGYGEPMNNGESISFHMVRSVIEDESGRAPIPGRCDWCLSEFGLDQRGDCIFYDVVDISSVAGAGSGFRLCSGCGERFAGLFIIAD